MPKVLSPAFLISSALALVDDAAAIDGSGSGMSAALARRYLVSDDTAPLPDGGWSAAFVHHVGYWSHYDPRLGASVWPLPATPSCTDLAGFAAMHFVLVSDKPQRGDIYLQWSPAKKAFARAGIVLGRTRRIRYASGRIGHGCLTVDGDTTPDGFLRGPYTAIVERVLCFAAGDRLIRWPLLERTYVDERIPAATESTRRRAA